MERGAGWTNAPDVPEIKAPLDAPPPPPG